MYSLHGITCGHMCDRRFRSWDLRRPDRASRHAVGRPNAKKRVELGGNLNYRSGFLMNNQ